MNAKLLNILISIGLIVMCATLIDAATLRDVVVSPQFRNATREAQDKVLKEYNLTWKEVKEAQRLDDIETRKNIYCTKSSPKVSFYFPGVPIPRDDKNRPINSESYWLFDVDNENSYQFNYTNLGNLLLKSTVSAEMYIDKVFSARCKGTGATIIDRKVLKDRSKTTVMYLTKTVDQGINKISYHKYVIEGSIYYNWSVHSYDNRSKLTAKYLYDKYSEYVGMANGYCR